MWKEKLEGVKKNAWQTIVKPELCVAGSLGGVRAKGVCSTRDEVASATPSRSAPVTLVGKCFTT